MPTAGRESTCRPAYGSKTPSARRRRNCLRPNHYWLATRIGLLYYNGLSLKLFRHKQRQDCESRRPEPQEEQLHAAPHRLIGLFMPPRGGRLFRRRLLRRWRLMDARLFLHSLREDMSLLLDV